MTWSPERRQRQSLLIRQWQPWTKSTGPKSSDGKALVSRNAWKGGNRPELRELARMVNAEVRFAKDLTLLF
jgi:hypothetical protein